MAMRVYETRQSVNGPEAAARGFCGCSGGRFSNATVKSALDITKFYVLGLASRIHPWHLGPTLVANFVMSRAGEAYDMRIRGGNSG